MTMCTNLCHSDSPPAHSTKISSFFFSNFEHTNWNIKRLQVIHVLKISIVYRYLSWDKQGRQTFVFSVSCEILVHTSCACINMFIKFELGNTLSCLMQFSTSCLLCHLCKHSFKWWGQDLLMIAYLCKYFIL